MGVITLGESKIFHDLHTYAISVIKSAVRECRQSASSEEWEFPESLRHPVPPPPAIQPPRGRSADNVGTGPQTIEENFPDRPGGLEYSAQLPLLTTNFSRCLSPLRANAWSGCLLSRPLRLRWSLPLSLRPPRCGSRSPAKVGPATCFCVIARRLWYSVVHSCLQAKKWATV